MFIVLIFELFFVGGFFVDKFLANYRMVYTL